eukprot:CAMPEP_0118707366 /NCGR_PEP_ID=MMETSP0800-20121206/21164_1 /TAXON_ID=210618 ORGANISM="Striatella unipunctata, Strain CCMP2910" /NCGR_SAMPLE_ID=MMETSP0800 /ASSEMBLY_ACC=CAM_ASM_000638 /LENGTH=111 /DNA_ID=CAMNT_0006610185 /DNA_START=177 /DNA_END=508 /DNA_ORIENTATION=+
MDSTSSTGAEVSFIVAAHSESHNNNNNNMQQDYYLQSWNFLELVCCVAFVVVVGFLIPSAFGLHERSIPYQKTQQGDLILDFAHLEENVESTVSTAMLFLLSGLLTVSCQV